MSMDPFVKWLQKPKMRRQFHLKNKTASKQRKTKTTCFLEKLGQLFFLKKTWSSCSRDRAMKLTNWIKIWIRLIKIRHTNRNSQLTDLILIWAICQSKWTWLGVVTLLNRLIPKKTPWTSTRGFECNRTKKKEEISMKLIFLQLS